MILYTVVADSQTYRTCMGYVARSDDIPENEGFYCIQFTTQENMNNDEDFKWLDEKENHGVFVLPLKEPTEILLKQGVDKSVLQK